MTNGRVNDKSILFVLSIDTEEEWDWSNDFPQENFNVNNVSKITDFQFLCENLGIRPTYFVDYAVVDDADAVKVLQPHAAANNCEIGAHLHPWCNPPFFGHVGEKESHVVNLPVDQVEQKLQALVKKLTEQFGRAPTSFRTGRWGIDGKVMQLLVKYGFNLDSSVYPFYQNDYYSCQGAPGFPYWPSLSNPLSTDKQNKIYELPVTVGFNHADFLRCEKLYRLLSHPSINWLRLVGIAWHTHILRKYHLSPELSNVNDMLSLCAMALKNNTPVLHMYMHSSSLVDNNNSLLGNKNAYAHISDAVTQVVQQLQQQADVRFCTISEAAAILQQREKH